jgi:hypothetical protein
MTHEDGEMWGQGGEDRQAATTEAAGGTGAYGAGNLVQAGDVRQFVYKLVPRSGLLNPRDKSTLDLGRLEMAWKVSRDAAGFAWVCMYGQVTMAVVCWQSISHPPHPPHPHSCPLTCPSHRLLACVRHSHSCCSCLPASPCVRVCV